MTDRVLRLAPVFLLVLFALFAHPAVAQAAPSNGTVIPVPPMRALVTDLTGTLSAEEQAQLEHRLQQFSDRKGSQIAVLMVPTTGKEPIEDYGLRVVERWKIGRKKADDGALLLVAKDDHTLRIEVGYGLEGVLPDVIAARVISETIAPRFREGDYFGGLDAGTAQMLRLVDGEPLPPAANAEPESPDGGRLLPVFLVAALAVGGILRLWLGRLRGAAVAAVLVGALAWFLSGMLAIAAMGAVVAFAFTLFGNGLGGLLRSGAGGGGEFGGGRGGSFGGGGASGKW